MSFAMFAHGCGLRALEYVPDGKIHRCPTEDHPSKKNGSYRYEGDFGWVQNWAVDIEPQIWHSPEQSPRRNVVDIRAAAERRDAEIRKMQEAAAAKALAILSSCKREPHIYLHRKGWDAEHPNGVGMVDAEGRLIIPMRDCARYSRVLSIQAISPDGTKKFLPGGRAKGAVFSIGNFRSGETWLCEGYATALSISAGLKTMCRDARVFACFSAGNLAHVAGLVAGERRVVADHDASGVGARFAASTGLPWAMPTQQGMDANDVHTTSGIHAVTELLRRCLTTK